MPEYKPHDFSHLSLPQQRYRACETALEAFNDLGRFREQADFSGPTHIIGLLRDGQRRQMAIIEMLIESLFPADRITWGKRLEKMKAELDA